MSYAVFILQANKELSFIAGPFASRAAAEGNRDILSTHDRRRAGNLPVLYSEQDRKRSTSILSLQKYLQPVQITREFVVRKYICDNLLTV